MKLINSNYRDKEGRIIIYWDAAKYNVDTVSEPEFIKCLVYCLEQVTERYFTIRTIFEAFIIMILIIYSFFRADLHAKGIVIVGNFTGWTMANFSTRVMNSFFGTLKVCYIFYNLNFYKKKKNKC